MVIVSQGISEKYKSESVTFMVEAHVTIILI